MPQFGPKSKIALATCHPDIQRVMNEAIKTVDFSVLEGHRGEAAQAAAFELGFSEVQWPDGKHNKVPSEGVDIAPWPIDWNDEPRFAYVAGHIMMTAHLQGVRLRWGGDWDGDTRTTDQTFMDWGHFELLR